MVAPARTVELLVLHGGLLALCVFAFLPFLVIVTILGLMCIVGIILGVAGADGAHALEACRFSAALLYAPPR
jgi:hypothetical protein